MNVGLLSSRYLELLRTQQQQQWENYSAGAHHDLNLLNQHIYELLAAVPLSPAAGDRASQILQHIALRNRVESHPLVARLRNKLDDWDNYLPQTPPHEQRGKQICDRALAALLRPDVLQLMDIRQQLARELGFMSYPDLVLTTEDLDRNTVSRLLSDYLARALPAAAATVQQHNLAWTSWFDGLDQLADVPVDLAPELAADRFFVALGYEQLQPAITLRFSDQSVAGFAAPVSPPHDVRLLVRPYQSLDGCLTLLHELGHGAAHAGNQERGLFLSWTATHDEVMAIVLEHAAAELLLSDNYLAAARAIWAVESCRCALSALFEFALWQTPDRAEELYPTYYRQIVRDPGPPELWVLDSFRSIDPVYIYTYVVGAATANRTVSFLRNRFGNDGRRWGRWLANRWLASGRRLTLPEKLAAIPGAAWHHD